MPSNRRVVTNPIQLQTALDDAASLPISVITIDTDLLSLNATILLPNTLATPSKHLIIEGDGVTIEPVAPGAGTLPFLMQVRPPVGGWTPATAATSLGNRFTIQDINFRGKGAPANNNTCLELTATTGSTVNRCSFNNATYGLSLRYAPQSRVLGCAASGIIQIAFDINEMIAGAANIYGSPFTRLENINVLTETNMFASVNFKGSGACILSQLNSGGKAPQHHVVFDSDANPAADNVMMDNIYIGAKVAPPLNPNSGLVNSAIKLSLFGGYAKISGVTNDYDHILIEADNTNTAVNDTLARVYFEHYTRIAAGTTFKTGGSCSNGKVIWSMFDIDEGRTIWQASRWYNGIVPVHRYSEFFMAGTTNANNKEIVTNFMQVNNNVISQ
jgi:hypothetical protein